MAKKTRNKLRSAKRTGTPIGEEPEQGVSEVQAEILNGGKYNINANSEELEEGVYEVEAVVDHRLRKGGTEYKVRWKGWSQEHDEWLHHSRMDCREAVEEYWKMKENRSARVREKQQRSDRAQRRSVSVNSNGIQMPAEPDEKIAFCENARDKQEHMSSSLQNNGTENSPSCSDSCELSIVKTSPQHDLSRTSPSSTSKVMPTPLFAKQFDVQNEEYFPVSSNLVTTNSVGVEDNAIIETLRKDDTAVKSVSVTSEPLSSHTPCNQSPPLKFPKLSIPKPPAIPQRKLISGKPNSQENVFSEITSTKVESAQKSIKMKISLKEKSLSFSCSDKSPVNTMDTALGVPPIQSVNKDCRETGNALMDSELREELSSEQCIEQEKSFSNKVVEDPHIEIDSLENKSKEIAEDFQMDIGATENKLEEESSCMGEMNNCFQKSVTGVSGYNCSTTEQSCSIQNNQKRIRPIRDHGFARGLSVERIHGFIQRSNILFAIVQFKNCDVVEVISVKVIQHYEPKALIRGFEEHCVRSDFAKSKMRLLDHQDTPL